MGEPAGGKTLSGEPPDGSGQPTLGHVPEATTAPTVPPAPARPAVHRRLLRLLDALGNHPRLVALGTVLGVLTGVATVVGWLLSAPATIRETLLSQAQAIAAADTREKLVGSGQLATLAADNHRLQEIIAQQAAALASLATADKGDAPPKVDDQRVTAALEQAAKGDRTGAEAVLGEVAAYRAQEAQWATERAAEARKRAADAYRQLGALAYLSSTEKALAAYQQAVRLDPDDAWAWISLNRLAQQAGQFDAAEAAAKRARDVAKAVSDERAEMIAESELGDVRLSQGDLAGALQAYKAAYIAAEKRVGSDPGNASWQTDLSVSWERLGDVRRAQGNLAGALQAYQENLAIRQRLAGADSINAEWQRALAVSWGKVGEVRMAQGDLAGALQAYGQTQAILTRVVGSDPGNAGLQRDLSVSWNKLGEVRLSQGDLAGALQAYGARHAIAERLAGTDPGNAEWQRDLIVSHVRLAESGAAPAEHYRQALAVARRMAASGTLAPADSWIVGELERLLRAAEGGEANP